MGRSSNVEVRYLPADGGEVVTDLTRARAHDIVYGRPIRDFAWHPKMTHYPGWFWSATMEDLVGYESLLERDWLLLADFDPNVVAIASQPFGLSGRDGSRIRHHVPDFLFCERDGSVVVVDVKPSEFVDKPRVAEVFEWTSRLLSERGWRYEVWTGGDPVQLTNLSFLRQGKRWDLVQPRAVENLLRSGSVGMTLGAAVTGATTMDVGPVEVRAALLALLWHQVWVVELETPLSDGTTITGIRQGAA